MIDNYMVLDEYWHDEITEVSTPAIYHCDCCGEDLYEGDEAYHINGAWYCEDCISNFHEIIT